MDIVKRLLLLLLLLLLLVPAVFAYFIMTDGGLRRMVSIGEGILGDDLEVASVEGKLIGPASIRGVAYKNAGTTVSVDSIDYDWQPKQLFSRKLSVDRLDVKGVTIRLPETSPDKDEEPSEPFKLSDLKIPFELDAKHLLISDINLYPPGADEPVVIDEIRLRAGGEDDAIELMEFSVSAPMGELNLAGSMNTSGKWPLDVDSDWSFNHEQFGQFKGEGGVTGDLEKLTVKHAVTGLVDVQLDAEVFDVLGEPSWDGNITASGKDLGKFSEGLAGVPVDLNVDTKGSLAEFYVDGTLATDQQTTGPLATEFKLNVFDATGDLSWDGNVKAKSADLGKFSAGLSGTPLELDVDTKGSLDEFTVDGKISTGQDQTGPLATEFKFTVFDLTGDVSWDGNVKAKSENLGPLSPGLAGIPLDLDVNTKGSLDEFYARGTVKSAHEQTGPLATEFNLTGDLEELTLTDSTIVFDESEARIAYGGTVNLKSLDADVSVDWTDLEYPLVSDPKMVLSPEGSLKFTGTPDNYKVQMETNVQQELAGDLNIVLAAAGTADKLTVNTLSVDGPPTSVYAVGVIDLKTRELDVKGNWKDVRWPLVGDEELVRSTKADFSVNGTLDDYKLDASLDLAGKDIPEGDWMISTRGNTESLSDLSITGDVLEGQIEATGDVVFSPTPEWDLAVSANGINPGLQWPEHEGKITLRTTTQGRMTDNGPDLVADIQSLSGNYRGQALGGGGQVAFANGKVSANGMKAKVGGATVDIDGVLGDDLDLKWKMNAEQLSDLVPGLKGNVALEGSVTGTREEPKLQFDLAAQDFKSGAVEGKEVTGGGVIDISGKTASNINIEAESFKLATYQWQDIKIQGDGRPASHELSVAMTGDAPDISLELKGGVEDEQWNGSLDKLEILQTPAGDWKLFEAVAIEASKQSAVLKVLCLTNLPAVMCLDGSWQSESGVVARLAVESFNSELFSDLMPPDVQIDAPLSGHVDLSVAPGGKPNAVAHFDIPAGKIQFESKGDLITAILGESEADVVLTDDAVNTTASLALGEIGVIDADVVISDLYGAQNLKGEVFSEVQDISLAGVGASQVESIDGAFFSNLKLGGTLKAPTILGDVNLKDFAALIPSLSLQLEDGNIRAVSDGNGNLRLEGQINSGEGDLNVGGFFNPESGQMEIELSGENFQVANAKRQKAVISPDLVVKIDGDNISVVGELEIPSAFIKAGGESGVVVESSDVVVVEKLEDRVEEDDPNSRVRLDVAVKLGDDVRVKAGQFDGALGGELKIEQLPGKVPTGTGTIEVVSGDFLVYGQKLTMERGNILFGGGPLDNPALDFDVARDVPTYEVTAGVKITGTAQAPILELQSDPEQTDANTLSFILFGKPVGTGVSYTLGKFITPDLYVSYGIDLLDKVRTFNARYTITDRLAAVAASQAGGRDDNDSGDLIYTIER